MYTGNIEVVRRIYKEALIDRDPRRFVDHFAAPDIEYIQSDGVEPGVRRGRKEVMLAMRRTRQSFSEYRHELKKVFDAGDTVVAAVSFHGKAAGVLEVVEREEAHIWTLRDEKVVRLEQGRSLESALTVARLSE
jgi:ketosteroid isomerase-like protein